MAELHGSPAQLDELLPLSAANDRLLLQFAPLIYVAWSDGILAESERAQIRARLAAAPATPAAVVSLVDHWLNPAQPPSPGELNDLVERMRKAAQKRKGEARRWFSLSELGHFLARTDIKPGEKASPELLALSTVEDALGIEGSDALNALLGVHADQVTLEPEHAVDAAELEVFLAGDRLVMRKRVFALLTDPICQLDPAAASAVYRQRVLECCQHLAKHELGLLAYPRQYGGGGRIADSIAAFETLAFYDLSLLVKFGVQFGLFGGSVLQLGTQAHHERYLSAIGRFELPGCFAMTESAHGSNVRDIETMASYDPASQEFVIHTPRPEARKDYIGNAAQDGQLAVVFAQLEVSGERHGVHAFLVPIRDRAGRAAAGVSLEDCGLKAGLNGVDNGRITFSKVRIPRANLLNRFGDVSGEGVYSSPIPSAARRFFTMLGTLVAGRMSIASASVSVSKVALTMATRYAAQRRQFGPEGEPEVPVLTYQSVQRTLLTQLATTYALDAALHTLVTRYTRAAESTAEEAEQREMEVWAASLKAYASWHAVDVVQKARETCGGAGYMAGSRLGTLREDVDIFTTFEGANVVLQQLVAKGLLSDYREQFGELRVWTVIKFMTARASTAVIEQNPIIKRKTDREHLRDAEFHQAALRFREQRLLASVARRLKSLLDDGLDSFAAMNTCQTHLLSLAEAHAERITLECFHARIEQCPQAPVKQLLLQLAALFALAALERDRAWYLESDYLEVTKSKAIRREVLELCAELAPHALTLVAGFGIPDALVRTPGMA